MRIVRVALIALAVGLAVAAPAAARDFPVAVPGQAGNDRTCDPCRTIAGALARARSLPGADTVSLGAGVYREDVTLDDPGGVGVWGRRFETVVRGRIVSSLPPPERLPGGGMRTYAYDPQRLSGFGNLVLQPTDGVVRVRAANLNLLGVDVEGRIEAEQAAVSLSETSVTTASVRPCAAALRLIGAPTSLRAGVPERHRAGVIVGSQIVGGTGIALAEADALVTASVVAADAAVCTGDAVRVVGGSVGIDGSVLARTIGFTLGAPGAAPGGSAVHGDNATVSVSSTTIGGSFATAVRMLPCFQAVNGCGGVYSLRGLAVAGAARTLDVSGDGIREDARHWIVGTGTFVRCPARAPCVETAGVERDRAGQPTGNVFGQLAEDPTLGPDYAWQPKPTGILIDAVTDNAGARAVGGAIDLFSRPRPVPILPGRPALYDIGAFEHPTLDSAPPSLIASLGVGPDWADVAVAPGGIVGGVIGGLGVPLRPGVANPPPAGAADAASPAGGGAAAVVQAAAGPRIEIVLPARARQGDVVPVRVKVPWLGRLAVRVYGAKGGLISVGRARKVNRGWRVVPVRLGPNARVGPMRVLASHRRAGKDTLSATATADVVRRPRGEARGSGRLRLASGRGAVW